MKESRNVVQNANSQNANQIAQTRPIPLPQSLPNNVGFNATTEIVKVVTLCRDTVSCARCRNHCLHTANDGCQDHDINRVTEFLVDVTRSVMT